MSHSLIPERMLVVSPSLANAIGLEEAIMLQAMNDGARSIQTQEPGEWSSLEKASLRKWLPFWSDLDIKRILKSLSDKGVIQFASTADMESSHDQQQLFFSFDANKHSQNPRHKAQKAKS